MVAERELPRGVRIVHADEWLAVVYKPAGLVVHEAPGHRGTTLVEILAPMLAGGDDPTRPGIVHRLDRDTSGCLVVAKHERALVALQASFKERVVEKRYVALVHGLPSRDAFTLDTEYGRHPTDRIRYTTRKPAGRSRRAISHVRVLQRFAAAAMVEVNLETGRTHQIRVHLSEEGHPLLADALYGGTRREAKLPPSDPRRLAAQAIGRQALHARWLSFPHPRTGEVLHFEAPLPADFEAALRILRAS